MMLDGKSSWNEQASATLTAVRNMVSLSLLLLSPTLATLLAPPAPLSEALAYLLVPQPNPIVPGYTDEMHCVTWG